MSVYLYMPRKKNNEEESKKLDLQKQEKEEQENINKKPEVREIDQSTIKQHMAKVIIKNLFSALGYETSNNGRIFGLVKNFLFTKYGLSLSQIESKWPVFDIVSIREDFYNYLLETLDMDMENRHFMFAFYNHFAALEKLADYLYDRYYK